MIVYLISHRLTGKAYVGKTKRTLEQRWREHLQASRSGSDLLLSRALRKHGPEAFLVTVLEGCADEVELDERERWWIAKLGTHGERGYNLTDGGDGVKGLVHTPETRARMSEARRGDKNVNFGKRFGINVRGWTDEERARLSVQRQGSGNPMSGRHHGEEARKKIGAATSIRKRKSVAQVSKEGTVLCVYPSLQDAAHAVNGQANKISEVLCGHRRTHKGYVWQYALDGGIAVDRVEV